MLALLQFDAGSLPVVEAMLAEGRLPTLAALRERGRWYALRSDTDFFATGTYAELYTGLGIPDHGLYYPLRWSAGEQRVRFVDAGPTPETVWERTGRAGARSLVLDPYQVWETAEIPGVCIGGWQFRNKITPRWSVPSGAYRSLARRFGRAPLLDDVSGARSASTLLGMRRDLLAGPRRAAGAALELMARGRYDLVWITFIGVHQAGHHFLDLARRTDASLERATARELERTVTDVYAEADAALGAILEAVPAGTDVIVFSPLGMGPNTSRSDLLPDMLEAVLRDRPASGGAGSSIWRVRAAIPVGLRARVARMLPDAAVREALARLYFRGVDWSRTRAFVIPGDHHGFVRLNVRGREREGIVDPGEAGALVDELVSGLGTFSDPDGAPSIASVERVAERVGGRHADTLPDLVVRWSDRPSAGLEAVHSPRFGRVARRGRGTGRSGNHAPGAWALVAAGSSRVAELDRPPSVLDIAATACSGVRASELPGRPLFVSS